jgi:hypothetical protein
VLSSAGATHHPLETIMSKSQDSKKTEKKVALKTPKEKKLAKKAKKEAGGKPISAH